MIGLRVLAGCNTQSAAARFVLIKPQQIIQHIQHLKQGTLPLQHGHNSLGMLAVYWLWACIMLLAVTGWLSRTDALWGEDWPVDLHACLSYILMASVVLHVVAVAVVSRLARQHLVLQMLHGQLAQFKGKPTRKHSSKR